MIIVKKPIKFFFKSFKKIDITKFFAYFFVGLVVFLSLAVIAFIFGKSIYFIQKEGLSFIFNNKWQPTSSYGFWNIIISTFWTLFFVMILVFFINKYASIFISQFLPTKIKSKIIFILRILSGLPSILFGVFVAFVVLKIFQDFGIEQPKSMVGAIIVLTLMILPTTLTLTVDKLNSFPSNYESSAYALGIDKINVSFDVTYASSKKSIVLILFYGFCRAIGEVTAVALVAGNSPNAPDLTKGFVNFFFQSITLLSSLIGLEIKENFSPMHESALFTISLFIMLVVFIVNIILHFFLNRSNLFHQFKKTISPKFDKFSNYNSWRKFKGIFRFFYWKILIYFRWFMMIFCFSLITFFFTWILGNIIWGGTRDFKFSYLITPSGEHGLLGVIVTTILLIVGTLFLAIPIAFFTAIFLNEYAKKDSKFVRIIKLLIFQLASSPTIIFGMFGLAFFVSFFGWGLTILSACFTMILVVFPIMIQTILQNLEAVPKYYRIIAFSLGLNKHQVIWKIVVPNSIKGIAVSLIFAANKVIAEVSPYIVILSSSMHFPSRGFLSSGRTISTHIYYLQSESTITSTIANENLTYQTALIALTIIFLTNFLISRIKQKPITSKN